MAVDRGKAPEGSSPEKRVSFAQDTKPADGATAANPADVDLETETAHVDGLIGQLEIYESGAVKMRLQNGILLDVCVLPRPHPSHPSNFSLHYSMLRWPDLTFFRFSVSCPAGIGSDAAFLPPASRPHRQTKQTSERPRRGLPTIRRHSERRYVA